MQLDFQTITVLNLYNKWRTAYSACWKTKPFSNIILLAPRNDRLIKDILINRIINKPESKYKPQHYSAQELRTDKPELQKETDAI